MGNKRKLFIGCSEEASEIAFEIKKIVDNSFIKTIDAKVFKETEWKNLTAILDNLKNYLDDFYYAVFIGYPDDIVYSRSQFYYSCRDNVIFEMGMFLTRLGRERTFFVIPTLNYNGLTPQNIAACGLKKNIDFKLLSDFGKSLIINSRIKLDLSLATRKNIVTGNNENYDKWSITTNLANELSQLLTDIKKEETKHDVTLTTSLVKESLLASKAKQIIEDIKQHSLSGDETDAFYISKLLNELPLLIYYRSQASEKSVSDTTIDTIELIYKFKDFLDTEQLAKRQNYKQVKKVWVLADNPIEFDARTKQEKLTLLRVTILENIKNGVEYTYIVNQKFNTRDIENLFDGYEEKDRKKYRKNIKIIKVDPKYFKTFFTLHFKSKEATQPDAIYMSALLPDRDDLLIQISDENHSKRVFERINKLVGYQPDSSYYVRDHVVQD